MCVCVSACVYIIQPLKNQCLTHQDLAIEMADSTLRSSRAVSHPSPNRILRRVISEVGSDPVHSTRYGRQRTPFSCAPTFELNVHESQPDTHSPKLTNQHTHTHTSNNTHTQAHTHTQTHTHTHTHTHTNTDTDTHTHTHTHRKTCPLATHKHMHAWGASS